MQTVQEKKNFEYESYQDNETILNYLKSLVDGFERGRLTLSSEEETIELFPSPLMKLVIKARRNGARNKLALKISWKDADVDPLHNKITIS